MTLSVRDGGTWKAVTPSVKDNDTWKPLVAAWVKDAGTWKQFYTNDTLTVNMIDRTRIRFQVGGTAYAGVQYRSSGDEYYVTASSLSWADSGSNFVIAGDPTTLHIRCTYTGTAPSGDLTSTWLALTSDRGWYLDAGAVEESSVLTISVSDDGGSTTLDSCTVNLTALAEIA